MHQVMEALFTQKLATLTEAQDSIQGTCNSNAFGCALLSFCAAVLLWLAALSHYVRMNQVHFSVFLRALDMIFKEGYSVFVCIITLSVQVNALCCVCAALPSRQLVFLYLVNDVLQYSKRKGQNVRSRGIAWKQSYRVFDKL
jgi:hypothetical protein